MHWGAIPLILRMMMGMRRTRTMMVRMTRAVTILVMSPTSHLGECVEPAGRERNSLTGLRYPLIQHMIYSTLYIHYIPVRNGRFQDDMIVQHQVYLLAFHSMISSIEAVKHIAEGLPAASSSTMHVHACAHQCCCSVFFCWMLWLTAHRKMSGRAATQQPDN